MHSRPRQILQQIVRQHGPSIAQDPRRVAGYLADLCGQYEREIFVLVHAQEVQIPQDLLNAGRMGGEAAHWQRLSRRLQDRLAFTEEAADWAVESWAVALGIQPSSNRAGWVMSQLGQGAASLGDRLLPSGRGWSKRGAGLLAVGLLLIALILGLPRLGNSLAGLGDQTPLPLSEATPDPAELSALLQRYLPMPRPIRLEEDLVPIRTQPDGNTQAINSLSPPGAVIQAEAVSPDGRWLRIDDPIQGWIPAAGVSMSGVSGPEFGLRLGLSLARIDGDGLRVRARPSIDAATEQSLFAGEIVVVVGESLDGAWYHIVEPAQGWISADFVQLLN